MDNTPTGFPMLIWNSNSQAFELVGWGDIPIGIAIRVIKCNANDSDLNIAKVAVNTFKAGE